MWLHTDNLHFQMLKTLLIRALVKIELLKVARQKGGKVSIDRAMSVVNARPGEIDVSVRVRPIVGNYVERRYVLLDTFSLDTFWQKIHQKNFATLRAAKTSVVIFAAIRAEIRCSRAWMSEKKDSIRSAMNFTGRASLIDAATAAISSPKV